MAGLEVVQTIPSGGLCSPGRWWLKLILEERFASDVTTRAVIFRVRNREPGVERGNVRLAAFPFQAVAISDRFRLICHEGSLEEVITDGQTTEVAVHIGGGCDVLEAHDYEEARRAAVRLARMNWLEVSLEHAEELVWSEECAREEAKYN